MRAVVLVWWFMVSFASGASDVFHFETEDQCLILRKVLVDGLSGFAAEVRPAVTITPCVSEAVAPMPR